MSRKQRKTTTQEKKRRSKTLIGAVQANRQYKSSVFADVMSVREAALEAFYALKNVKLADDTPVEIITLSDVMYLGQLNDVAFLINNVMILLLEHQSSQSQNLPTRIFIYLGRQYEKVLAKNNKELYGSTLVKIPRPEFYVLYNGKTRLKDDNGNDVDFRTYKMSDAFMDAPGLPGYIFQGAIELEVPVYDINDGHNKEILERSARLRQYAQLIAKIREFEAQGAVLQQAIKQAVEYCIENDILKDYLKERASEVLSMLFEDISMEDYGDVRYQNGLLDAVVNIIKTLRITLTDAMNVVKLDQKYRNQVIEELRKQNITYKE